MKTDNLGEHPARDLLVLLMCQEPLVSAVRERLSAGIDWAELHRLTLHHQVLPQLYQGLKPYRELVPNDDYACYQGMHAANTLRNLSLQRELDRLLVLLKENAVCCTPLRGPSLAVQAYADVALRVFSDLDLYLRADDVLPAIRCLEKAGYRLDFALQQERWQSLAKIENQLSLVHLERDWLVELHWRMFNPLYALQLDRHLADSPAGWFEIEEQLVMLSAHGGKHIWEKLKWVVDIDRLLSSADRIDWQKVMTLAESCGCLRMVCLGLLLVEKLGRFKIPVLFRQKIDGNRQLHVLAALVWQRSLASGSGKRHFLEEFRYHLMVRERWRDRLRLSWRWLLWPRLDDWRAWSWGDRCFVVYLVGRPLRMVWKWVIRPLVAGNRGTRDPGNG